jgi:hypothetical protein
MWWCRKKYADPTNTQKSIRNILRMEWGCIIKIHVQNPFDNLLALELLLPIFAYSNAILKFELPKKTSLPYCQPSLLYIWRERDHVWDLFHNQRKIEKCYITKFEHLNLKLEKQKHNKKEHFWRKMKKKCFIYNIIHDAKGLPCVTICQIGSQETWAWGIFWPPLRQQIHSTSWTKTTSTQWKHFYINISGSKFMS